MDGREKQSEERRKPRRSSPAHHESAEKHTKTENKEKKAGDDVRQNKGAGAGKKDDPAEMLKEALRTVEEYKNALQRLQAEFENFQKRASKEESLARSRGACALMERLLPVLDSIDQARKQRKNHQAFIKGCELIFDQIEAILKKEGLEKIDDIGVPADPFKHDVMMRQEAEDAPGTIIQVVQPGYKVGDAIVRHAKVVVAKKKEA
ncbi:nucleotide exchange factor GrpE [Candidatus Woesearchaeota archaeon]|nr:MAG: nucleotide exchange factor GrpE [Candidatus Woesearchaeota archaeon]